MISDQSVLNSTINISCNVGLGRCLGTIYNPFNYVHIKNYMCISCECKGSAQ